MMNTNNRRQHSSTPFYQYTRRSSPYYQNRIVLLHYSHLLNHNVFLYCMLFPRFIHIPSSWITNWYHHLYFHKNPSLLHHQTPSHPTPIYSHYMRLSTFMLNLILGIVYNQYIPLTPGRKFLPNPRSEKL